MKVREFLFGLASAVLLGAGAIAAEGDQKEETPAEAEDAAADPRLGPEVDSICFGRSINGWKTVEGHGDAVLLEKGVNDWFLVEVSGNCRAQDFKFAQTIGIETRPAGGCVRRGDYILVETVGRTASRCFIQRIYEWNDDLPEAEAGEEE